MNSAKGGHHLGGQVVQVLVVDAHLLHHIVNGLDAHLSGAFQAQTLVFGGAVFHFGDKDHCDVFAAAAAHSRLHNTTFLSGKGFLR